MSAEEIAGQSRREEKALAARYQSIAELDTDAPMEGDEQAAAAAEEEAAEEWDLQQAAAEVAREAKRERGPDQEDEDEEYEDPGEEDEEEEDEEEEDEEDEYEEFPRRRLSRSAKTAGLERREQAKRATTPPKQSLIDHLCQLVLSEELNRPRKGFTVQKARIRLQKQLPAVSTAKFNVAWAECVERQFVYNVLNDAKMWKFDVQRYRDTQAAKQKGAKAAKHTPAAQAKRRASIDEVPMSGDEDDVVLISPTAKTPASVLYPDPTIALFKQLRASPWKAEIERSEQAEAERERREREAAQAAKANAKQSARPISAAAPPRPPIFNPLAERRSRRQSGLLPDGVLQQIAEMEAAEERKHQAQADTTPPVSSLSTLTVKQPAFSEHKEERRRAPSPTDDDGDVEMKDATPPAPPTDAPPADALFLRSQAPGLLSEFLLFTILRASKMNLKELRSAVEKVRHLPQTFKAWALQEEAEPDPEEATREESKEGDVAMSGASSVASSPIVSSLDELVSRGLVSRHSAPRRGTDYLPTSLATEQVKSLAVPILTPTKLGRGKRSAAAMQHAEEMRSLKAQMAVRQISFLAKHKAVFAPFCTSNKLRAALGLGPLLARQPTDATPTTVVDYPLLPIPTLLKDQHLIRDYQVKGFSFLAHIHDHGASAILADEMGLGSQCTRPGHRIGWTVRSVFGRLQVGCCLDR